MVMARLPSLYLDKFGMYNIDPSKLVASMYGDPKDEDPEELALMKQEVEDIWNS